MPCNAAGDWPDKPCNPRHPYCHPNSSRTMSICRERHRGPMVMVVNSPEGSHRLSRTLPFLSDFPCADIPPCLQDCAAYPTLQWQAKAAKVGLARAVRAAYWLQVSDGIGAPAPTPYGYHLTAFLPIVYAWHADHVHGSVCSWLHSCDLREHSSHMTAWCHNSNTVELLSRSAERHCLSGPGSV